MNIPGFTAEASLAPAKDIYGGNVAAGRARTMGMARVAPQLLRSQPGPDLGAYWRCIANGGDDLICRFFGGLPPFTIGDVLAAR
jgi:hypothetical protein